MSNPVYENIAKSWQIAGKRTQFKFVLVLLVIFPLLFIFMLQQFLTTATVQVESALKQSISHDHETIASLLATQIELPIIANFVKNYSKEGDLVTNIEVVHEERGELIVKVSNVEAMVGARVSDENIYQSAIAHTGDSVIYPYLRNGERVWLTYRAININGEQWYVHSEIDLSNIDNQLERQVNKAYFILVMIFVFLIIVVWWFWRQYDYKQAWQLSKDKLDEQFSFTNMMVHELRAPLTAIRGYASLISESNSLPEDQRLHVDRISDSAVRLVRLVNDFLEVARIQSGTLKVSLEESDVRETVQTVVEEMKSVAEAKNLVLTCTVPSSPVLISTDIARLHQIVTNLLSNAIKYTNEGSISVVLNKNPREVEIRVQDSGHGISAKDQTLLFKPFMRVGGADAGAEVGSGLGMWITKQLVKLLNGDVDIESIENVGTHAIVHLYYKK